MGLFYIVNPEDAYRISLECLDGQHEDNNILVVQNDRICVWTGAVPNCDIQKCEELGIPIAYGEYLGGSIVCMPDDLSIMEIKWGTDDWILNLFNRVLVWLQEKGLNAIKDENDILVDGKKIFSIARATTAKGWCQSCCHFSIGEVDLELIDEICQKEMKKIPGSLGEYGITAEDIILEFGFY